MFCFKTKIKTNYYSVLFVIYCECPSTKKKFNKTTEKHAFNFFSTRFQIKFTTIFLRKTKNLAFFE